MTESELSMAIDWKKVRQNAEAKDAAAKQTAAVDFARAGGASSLAQPGKNTVQGIINRQGVSVPGQPGANTPLGIMQRQEQAQQAQRSSPENIAAFFAATNKSPAAVLDRIAPKQETPSINIAGFEKPKGLDLIKAGPEYMLARQHGLDNMQQGDGASALKGQAEYWGGLAEAAQKGVNEPARDLNILKAASALSAADSNPFMALFQQPDPFAEAKQETAAKLSENTEKYQGYLAKQNEALRQSYSSLFGNADFAQNSGEVMNGERSDPTLKRINGENNTNAVLNNPTLAVSEGFDKLRTGGLDYLTDDERAAYNYLYNTQGKAAADEFINYIEGTLNSRYGEKLAGDVRGSVLGQYAMGYVGGLDRSGAGIMQLFDKNVSAPSPLQFASGQIRQDLAGVGPQVLGSSLGQMGFDAANTIGNMAPALLLSAMTGGTAGPALGAAYTGLSTSGNAYAAAINDGLTPAQARTYGALVGAAEGGLQYLLGGIGKLGGVADDVLLAKVQGINNALARVALTGAVKIGSEVTEENLQDILEPAFKSLVTGEKYDAPTFEQLAYTTLLTALTTGALESGAIASAGRSTNAPENARIAPLDAAQGALMQSEAPSTFDINRAVQDGPGYIQELSQQQAARAEAESTSINTNPAQHTPAEQSVIDDYQNAVDDSIKLAFEAYAENPQRGFSRHTISPVSSRQANEVSTLLGGNYSGYSNAINSNGIIHILNEHGPQGTTDRSFSDLNDAARIAYIFDNYDDARIVTYASGDINTSSEFRNANNEPAPMVQFSKKVNGTYYVVEAIPDSKHKKFWVVSAYMNKTGDGTQAPNALSPGNTPNASLASSSPVMAGSVPTTTAAQSHGDNVLNGSGQSLSFSENASSFKTGTLTESNSRDNTSSIDSITQTPENSNTQNALPDGTGAASAGFAGDYAALQQQSSQFIAPGEGPVAESRLVDVPAQDFEGLNISQSVRTALEAEVTPDAAVPTIEQAIADGDFSYDKITNAETLERAKAKINERGFELAFADWKQDIQKKTSADNVAMGWALYNGAVNGGNTTLALEILTDIAGMQRNAAQALQAQRILKKMSPEGQLLSVQRSVANLQEELVARHGDKAPDLHIDEALVQEFLDAESDKARQDALYNIYKDIGRQMPAAFADKWNAWRYMAMLTNFRTHIRNIAGNLGFVPVRAVKNAMATVLEEGTDSISRAMGGGGIERTKAFLNYTNAVDRALVKSTLADYANMQEQILASGKFDGGVNTNQAIQDGRKIFNSRVAEGLRTANNTALDAEDGWFSKPAYGKALAGWLKANKVTLDTATTAQLDKARAYAIKEAQKATYRDLNAFSAIVTGATVDTAKNKSGSKIETGLRHGASALVEGVLPFKKTPANILVRGVEYSPAGLLKSITYDAAQVHKGNMSAAEMLDNLSAGLTGTGVMALGGLLASLGYITGGSSGDDDQDDQDKLTGHQSYALEIGGKSITLDWLAPVSIPFFIGVELWNNMQEGKTSFWDFLSSLGTAAEPMLEMSMLQSLNDLFDAGRYSEGNKLLSVLLSGATSYFTQAVPTLSGQIARSIDGTRRTSYTDPNSETPAGVQYFLQSFMGKVPGLASTKEPYVDAWGREETEDNALLSWVSNLFNPAYTSNIKETAVDDEIQRLFDAGAGEVFPSKSAKTFDYDGEKIAMTAEEYTEFSKVMGQTAYDMIAKLISTKQYAAMSDEQKVKTIDEIYTVAMQNARKEILAGRGIDYELDGNAAKISEAEQAGVSPADWFKVRYQYQAIGEIGDDKTLQATQFANWLSGQGYSVKQQNVLLDQMKYWNMFPAEATRYNSLTEAGIAGDSALKITEALALLTAPAGRTNVQAYQQYGAIANMSGLSEKNKITAMAEYEGTSSGDKSKVLTAAEYGISMADFAAVAEAVSNYRYANDKSSTLSKADVTSIINSVLELDDRSKAVFWALYTTAKSGNPWGNVYSYTLEWAYAE